MREELSLKYDQRLLLLKALSATLEQQTIEALSNLPRVDRVHFRVKGRESFLAKALDPRNKPAYGDPLAEIEDQVAGRILVFFLSDIGAVTTKLQGAFTPVESTRRRPEKDEEFGYESHHLICVIPPQAKPKGWESWRDLPTTFEIQIRTLFMHAWAEIGRAHV